MRFRSDNIKWAKDMEHVRLRPLMYVGSLSSEGLELLLGEVLDNALDEALAGHCKSVRTTLFPDGSVAVEDDGRGIPVSRHSIGIPALEVIFTKLGACYCGCEEPPAHRHGGWGVGVAVVNGLSEWLVVETSREGQRYRMRFERGVTVGGLERVGPATARGTCVRFRPDPTIFEPTAELRPSRIAERLGEIAALVPELGAELVDQSRATRSFRCPGGLADLVAASSETPLLGAPIVASAREKRAEGGVVEVRLALQVDACERDVVIGFVNFHRVDAGTHIAGLGEGAEVALRDVARALGLPVPPRRPAGLRAAIALTIPDPVLQFGRLVDLPTRYFAAAVARRAVASWASQHPIEARTLLVG